MKNINNFTCPMVGGRCIKDKCLFYIAKQRSEIRLTPEWDDQDRCTLQLAGVMAYRAARDEIEGEGNGKD